jgi:hypothetical protein
MAVTFELNQKNRKKSSDGILFFDFKLHTCHATILSPSFGSPGVFEPGKPITLYVLADERFYTAHQKDENSFAEKVINFHLKITPWNSTKKLEDKLIYPKGSASSHITCTYLSDLRPHKGADGEQLPAEIRIRNKEQKLVACIRESTRDYYINGSAVGAETADKDGVIKPARPFLFQIDLKPDGMNEEIKPDVFYDCAWFINNEHPHTSDEAFCELQDLDCRQFAKEKSPKLLPKSLLKVKEGKVDFAHFDDASPIQAFHPFMVSSKPHLNIGQLSDVHISSRQATFRKSGVRVLEGLNSTPTIGELVNTTLDSFSDMLKQMANDATIDAIVITGDLIDYNHNLMPPPEIANAGTLWDMLHHDKHPKEELYPRYLDSLVIFSLLKSYYDKPKWNKPIFLISGNHENYQDMYGISPRIGDSFPGVSNKGIKRANPGVPADHNLTIYEACLMYGPDFGWYSKTTNFKKTYADWFYRIFTPLTDYRFTFQKQSIVALGWGDDESIMNLSALGSDTTLYRATNSVSNAQLELINEAAAAGTQRLICTHYPFASYDVNHCLGKEGKINCNDLLPEFDHFSQGTFKKNRAAVYKLVADSKFHFTLSGHSHRAGIYAGSFENGQRPTYTVHGHEIPLDAAPMPGKDKCNMVVSGCSGPIGTQNHYATLEEKGLGGWGLDYPSGNHLSLAPGSETIKRIIPKNTSTAKPRFAVALDYMDIIGREDDKDHHGVFTSIVSDATGACFTFTVNENLPATHFIKEIALVAYLDDSPKVGRVYPMALLAKGERVFEAKLEEASKRVVATKLTPSSANKFAVPTLFRVTFNTALSGLTGYTQYNFDTPWTYPIEIVDRKAEMRKMLEAGGRGDLTANEIEQQVNLVSGYELKRHQKFGEVPDFKWYNKNFGYGFPHTIT